jgi:hypothetical protein
MVPPRFAVWFPQREEFQVYDVDRERFPALAFKPTYTNRGSPFYFAIQDGGEAQSRTITMYRPRARIHSHVDMAMWFTGAWLCRRNDINRMQGVIPIMGISDMAKLQFNGSLGIHHTPDFDDWKMFQAPDYHRAIIHNRMFISQAAISSDTDTSVSDPVIPAPIPKYVAQLLVKDAISNNVTCPITMDALETDNEQTAVTSCYHVFQKDAIQMWMVKNTSCPVCKQACSITVV